MPTERTAGTFKLAELQLETLLAPIAGDSSAGESLRYEGTYDAIQEARREDDPTLPQGVWQRELKKGDWRQVAALCSEALETESKDLQIAAWLLEALLRLHGLRGGALGLEVLAGLVDAFWEVLYPEIEEGDVEGRLAPLEWVNNKLAIELKTALVTRATSSEGRDYSWLDWERALYASHLESDGEQAADDPERPVTCSDVLTRVSLTDTVFYRELRQQLEQASSALASLHDRLREQCGDDAPSLSQFEDGLEGMSGFVGRILKERSAMEESQEEVVIDSTETETKIEAPGDDGEALEPGPIKTRAEAYRMLSLAADYLMRTEPHSPSPYLVRRAVTWGAMPLAEVLKELLSLGSDLDTVYRVLGLHGAEGKES